MSKQNKSNKDEGILDKILSKFSSRKLFAVLIATTLIIFGKISGDNWEKIIMVYLVTQGAVDTVVSSYFGAGNYSNSSPDIKEDENLEGKGDDDIGGDYLNKE